MLVDFEKPNNLDGKTFDNFEVTSPEQSAALRIARGIVGRNSEVNLINGLWLWSNTFGTGKTHLLAAIHEAIDIDPEKKLWLKPVDTYGASDYPLSRLIHGSVGAPGEYRRAIENAEVIFIDELTILKMGARVPDFIKFFQLAYEQGIKLFASSNHPIGELGERLDKESVHILRDRETNRALETVVTTDEKITGRVQSRLTQMMTPIEILGRDYREILAEKAIGQVSAILEEEKRSWGQN